MDKYMPEGIYTDLENDDEWIRSFLYNLITKSSTNKQSNHIWKLGMFVIGALVVFAATIFFIGKKKIFWINLSHPSKFQKNVMGCW
jgi:L-cystine uptake protein TcyP (sodium:dicarboxylate symporter family)